MGMIAADVENAVVPSEAIGVNGDSLEAEAWAYLAVRSLKGLPITFPGTTGVPRPMTGGVLARRWLTHAIPEDIIRLLCARPRSRPCACRRMCRPFRFSSSCLPSKKWLAVGMMVCSILMPFWALVLTTARPPRRGHDPVRSPLTSRPDDGQGARKL